VGEVLAEAVRRHGPHFAEVLARSRVWCNGEPVDKADALKPGDEVAVLPPVSGG
jgi:molybdopterin converting factor small subunit